MAGYNKEELEVEVEKLRKENKELREQNEALKERLEKLKKVEGYFNRKRDNKKKLNISAEEVYRLYTEEHKSMYRLAKIYNTSVPTISSRIKEYEEILKEKA